MAGLANGDGVDDIIDQAADGIKKLIAAYRDEKTAYPSVPDLDNAPSYNDYLHLARFDEWKADGFGDLFGDGSRDNRDNRDDKEQDNPS